jgi:uncharacterized membrane protein
MSDATPTPPAAFAGVAKTAEELQSLKTITTVVYALQALSFIWGLPALVAVIINYVKRDDARGTLYESHFHWQIKSFWWGLLWTVLGIALAFILIGFVVLLVAYVWMIYRVVKGWLKLADGKPVYPA